jgi:imidazole glycerol phosphate synthase glutamine amidotransferase subunit
VRVAIVSTGAANLASVASALGKAGATPVLAESAADVARAERLVLPGVGAFAAAVRSLVEQDLISDLRARIADGAPTLAICLGMQLLFDASDEAPGIMGLGVAQGRVERFSPSPELRVPQMGWNHVAPEEGARLLVPGYAYFANSYRVVMAPSGWVPAWSVHGDRFLSGMERGDVLACQFHPELSGDWGADLLARWLEC